MVMPKSITTWVEFDGREPDVLCEFDYQPSEYDTRTDEWLKVTRVVAGGHFNILSLMTDDEVCDLHARLLAKVHEIIKDNAER